MHEVYLKNFVPIFEFLCCFCGWNLNRRERGERGEGFNDLWPSRHGRGARAKNLSVLRVLCGFILAL